MKPKAKGVVARDKNGQTCGSKGIPRFDEPAALYNLPFGGLSMVEQSSTDNCLSVAWFLALLTVGWLTPISAAITLSDFCGLAATAIWDAAKLQARRDFPLYSRIDRLEAMRRHWLSTSFRRSTFYIVVQNVESLTVPSSSARSAGLAKTVRASDSSATSKCPRPGHL